MDTLQLHDSFEPYFAGRPSAAPAPVEPNAEAENARRLAVQHFRKDRLLPVRLADLRRAQVPR